MRETNYAEVIATRLQIRAHQIAATIDLLDSGNTIPFIARYRKEATGSLDEEQLRQIADLLDRQRNLDKRREAILASIGEQGKLTPELEAGILAAETLTILEDLYLPYKPKRRTRASIAREKGLAPLAEMILTQPHTQQTLKQIVTPYLNEAVTTVEDALSGARDIVAEVISDNAQIRGAVRAKALQWGMLHCEKAKDAEDPKTLYQTYYDFEYRIDRIQHYQILAINRGEAEKVLRVIVDVAERDWRGIIESLYRGDHRSIFAEQLALAVEDAARRLLLPAIERDVRRELSEKAEAHAIQVFAANLRGLLSQPPLSGHTILGIDPGFRTGSKVAIIDLTGKVIATDTIYPHLSQKKSEEAKSTLTTLINQHQVTLIAIGNGTASRETEQLVAELTREMDGVHYVIVNEAGASVYSASPLAREELPDLDVTLRGAVSIARRLQDPLAEQVKIDPKSIGVGLYQHDVNQQQLSQALDGVVESVVNQVGVDLNTASPALLTHVAGIGQKLAERIITYRDENGIFQERKALKQVAGLGPKAYEQAAGFLRIRGGKNPLDASAIHPESYTIAQAALKRAGVKMTDPLPAREAALSELRGTLAALAAELNTGLPTLNDIIDQLIRPGRDPREDLPMPLLRSDVLTMEDLQVGMQLSGTARNVVDFGVFVDIGVKQDGLLHRSQIPREMQINVGDILEVEILNVEIERGRISLGLA